ncbi:hypothetical protein RRG08_024836 [Elysia crispata]|uniref:Uncharacterized protein n=1 Tax=Elysia crispata TaxID=231223 RepID=A0AAE0YJA1_9GAST|nr:hypothetical protein RRG08_024836 [Elysia crispata]
MALALWSASWADTLWLSGVEPGQDPDSSRQEEMGGTCILPREKRRDLEDRKQSLLADPSFLSGHLVASAGLWQITGPTAGILEGWSLAEISGVWFGMLTSSMDNVPHPPKLSGELNFAVGACQSHSHIIKLRNSLCYGAFLPLLDQHRIDSL